MNENMFIGIWRHGIACKQRLHPIATHLNRLDIDLHVKIADFGLCRPVYDTGIYVTESSELPVRWSAPECLRYGVHSYAGDVVGD
jgi:hypothetical protein